MRVVFIDNYDSFTYNLVQLFGAQGIDLEVFRNDAVTIKQLRSNLPDRIVISPGPGRPENAGISCDVIREFYKEVPILGVCLGHQCIGHIHGMSVINASKIMHGKTSQVIYDDSALYAGVDNPFEVMRYHSLVLDRDTIHEDLKLTSWTNDEFIMGIEHKNYPLFGVQFHPESFLTPEGEKIIKNFLEIKY